MEDVTPAVRETLGVIDYDARAAPALSTPQDDSPMVEALITDPIHCTARHTHHDFQAAVASAMCGLVGRVPADMFQTTFSHHPTPPERAHELERKEDWIFKEVITEEHKQSAIFLALAGWMSIVKVVDELKGNYVYVEKRWKAAVTGLGLTDRVCNTNKKDIIVGVSGVMNRSREVKSRFIKMFISMNIEGSLPTDTVRAAMISQIKMVWEFSGMCSYRLMDDIIFIDSPILGIETVAKEACAFRRIYRQLQERMGTQFPYSGVLGLVPADMSISHFPNLYLVAISHAKGTGGMANFQISTNVKASVPIKVLSKAVKGMTDTTIVSDTSVRDLAELGLVSAEGRELQRKARALLAKKRRKDSDTEDDDDEDNEVAGPSKRRR